MVLFHICVFWSEFMLFALTHQSKVKEHPELITL